MSSGTVDDADHTEPVYPRFDHGLDLWIIVHPDGRFEFRTETHGESIAADNAVYLKDVT